MTRSAALTGVCALVTALLPPGTMVAAPTVHRQGMQPFVIAARGAFPVIDGRVVIWSVGRTVPGGGYIPHADLEGLDLSTGRRFPVLSGGTAAGTVALSGKTAVWVDCRHCVSVNGVPAYTGTKIYARNLADKRAFPLALDGGNQDCPAISGRRVIWTERYPRRGIVGKDLSTHATPGSGYLVGTWRPAGNSRYPRTGTINSIRQSAGTRSCGCALTGPIPTRRQFLG